MLRKPFGVSMPADTTHYHPLRPAVDFKTTAEYFFNGRCSSCPLFPQYFAPGKKHKIKDFHFDEK